MTFYIKHHLKISIQKSFLLVISFVLIQTSILAAASPFLSKIAYPGYEIYEQMESNKSRHFFFGKILLNTSGKVYSVNKGKKTSALSNSTRVKVTVTKTGGKAKTEISIFTAEESIVPVPHLTLKKRYTFENGNYTRTKTFTVFKAKDKQIQVWLDNKSFSNTFDYTLKVEEI